MYFAVSLVCLLGVADNPNQVSDRHYSLALNAYGAVMTTNKWEELLNPLDVDYEPSYLGAVTVARPIAQYKRKVTFEIEGQAVKHFNQQHHWEFNMLAVGRWEPFWWDKYLDTSLAFGIGPSYATKKPYIEIVNDGDTSRWLVYWMIELAFTLPQNNQIDLITRIHHRSNAFGLIAENGGSNAMAIGLKVRL